MYSMPELFMGYGPEKDFAFPKEKLKGGELLLIKDRLKGDNQGFAIVKIIHDGEVEIDAVYLNGSRVIREMDDKEFGGYRFEIAQYELFREVYRIISQLNSAEDKLREIHDNWSKLGKSLGLTK